jgi:hypothetical protein
VDAAVKPSPFWKTYAALAVLGGLGAYIYFVESKREVGPDGEVKKKEKVFAFDKAKARAITVASLGGESLRLAREKEGWRLTAPQAVAADGTEVESLLTTLEGLESDDVVAEAPTALKEYGLEPPKATITVDVEGAPAPLSLQIGEKTPDGGALYARTAAAARVFTVPSFTESSLVKKPFDLRDRSVLHVTRESVRGLEITGPEGAYALARREGDEWAITAPVQTRAGRWPVDGLLGALESLRMESVAAEDAKDVAAFGLAPPVRTVTLVLADGTRRTLEIGQAAGAAASPAPGLPAGSAGPVHARVAGSPLVAVIPGALVDDLAKGLAALRATRLLDVATYEVVGFDVEVAGAPKRTYVRSSQKDKEGVDVHTWKRTAPDAKDLTTNTVQDALFLVGAVEVRSFVDAPAAPATYGLDAPAAKVSLRYDGGKPATSFEVGRKGSDVFGRRAGDNAVLALDPAKAEELLKALGGL